MNDSSSANLRQIASQFRLTGWISFWIQVVLGVVSTFTLAFAALFNRTPSGARNPGTGAGLALAIFGLLVLYVSIYWAFRYTRIGRKLNLFDPSLRPKRAETLQTLRMGLSVNLVGMLLTLLGAEATVGGLIAKGAQAQGGLYNDPSRLIQALDIFVVQANTNILMAQFIGIVAALWLFTRVSR